MDKIKKEKSSEEPLEVQLARKQHATSYKIVNAVPAATLGDMYVYEAITLQNNEEQHYEQTQN